MQSVRHRQALMPAILELVIFRDQLVTIEYPQALDRLVDVEFATDECVLQRIAVVCSVM
jgi:hypothetical protein